MKQWGREDKEGTDTKGFRDAERTELGHPWLWGGEKEEGVQLAWFGR